MSIFNDTKIAFKDKSTAQLQKAYWMFKAIELPALTALGVKSLNFTIENNFPLVEGVVRRTLFQQFVGGETREKSMEVVQQLFKSHIGSIFDYSIEGKAEESVFDQTCAEIKQNIRFAQGNPAIPFVVFKPSGFGRIEIYDEIGKKAELTSSQKEEWARVVRRFDEIGKLAYECGVRIMADAEESWMQDAADMLVNALKSRYNKEKAIVWNTVQMYRTGRLEVLEKELQKAQEQNYFLGYKFVRGAYMEKERARAAALGYPDPIQLNKQATDDNYNAGINFVMQHLDRISAYFGTHNEKSTELVLDKMKERNLPNDFEKIHFGQLYGMSDNITYYLGDKKYNASKYLPYGPVREVVPYLTRRAQENTSVAGQTGRELGLIKKELERRKREKV